MGSDRTGADRRLAVGITTVGRTGRHRCIRNMGGRIRRRRTGLGRQREGGSHRRLERRMGRQGKGTELPERRGRIPEGAVARERREGHRKGIPMKVLGMR